MELARTLRATTTLGALHLSALRALAATQQQGLSSLPAQFAGHLSDHAMWQNTALVQAPAVLTTFTGRLATYVILT